jgi:hypothetical protein
MARRLTYLVGLPHHGSLFTFSLNSYALPKSFEGMWCGLYPSLEGEVSLGMDGPKKKET